MTMLKFWRYAIYATALMIVGYAIVSIVDAVMTALKYGGSIDFHSYWVGALLLTQYVEPWGGTLDLHPVAVPISHLIGPDTHEVPVPPFGPLTPLGLTAPLAIVITAFTAVSWDIAKTVWLGLNLVSLITVPVLIIRIAARYGFLVRAIDAWVIGVLLAAMAFTRLAIGHGQSTLILLWLSLIAIVLGDSSSRWQRVFGGVLLGIALSKPTVLVAASVFLLLRRRFDVIVIASAVQLIGLMIVAWMSSETPVTIVSQYWRMLRVHSNTENQMNLAQSPILYGMDRLGTLSVIAGTALVIYALRHQLTIRMHQRPDQNNSFDFTLYALLSAFMLLVTYHWTYDAVHSLPIFVVALVWLRNLMTQPISISISWRLGVTVACVMVPLLPGNVLTPYLFPQWTEVQIALHTIVLLTLMVFLIVQLRKCSLAYPSTPTSASHM